MQIPKFPSIFKNSNSKTFSYIPRYYDARKERIKKLEEKKVNIIFRSKHTSNKQKGRWIKIVFLIIILSLLSYKFIIN